MDEFLSIPHFDLCVLSVCLWRSPILSVKLTSEAIYLRQARVLAFDAPRLASNYSVKTTYSYDFALLSNSTARLSVVTLHLVCAHARFSQSCCSLSFSPS